MTKIKCPIENCQGFETTSGRSNLLQHVKNLAKSELLAKHIIGKGETKHADYLRDNAKMEQVTIFRLKDKTFTLHD
jgi:hypothetical protein